MAEAIRQAMHLALQHKHPELFEFCLQYGADTRFIDILRYPDAFVLIYVKYEYELLSHLFAEMIQEQTASIKALMTEIIATVVPLMDGVLRTYEIQAQFKYILPELRQHAFFEDIADIMSKHVTQPEPDYIDMVKPASLT